MPGELVLRALAETCTALQLENVRAAIMGGLAITHWGHARFTKDVDLLISIEPAQVERIIQSLQTRGFVPRRHPLVSRIGKHSFIQLLYTPKGRHEEIPVDLLLADSEFMLGALDRVVPYRFGETTCQVTSCEDLILLKLQADRIIDRNDVRYLLEYNRPSLDFVYLKEWIAQLELQPQWAEWWTQAFPGEPVP